MRHVAIVLAVCLLAASCGGSSKGAPKQVAPTATPTPAVTYRDLTDDQLGAIALPLEEWGQRYTGFTATDASGLLTITTRSRQACQSSKESAALSKYGWSRSYARAFEAPDRATDQAIEVGSIIDVFSSDENAAGKLNYDVATDRDDTRVAGGCSGLTIEGVDDLAVSGIGDQTAAVRERFSYQGIRGSMTMVMFRRGKVVVMVYASRLSAEDSLEELTGLARKLDERLMPVLTSPLS